jgi:hypothetical protein
VIANLCLIDLRRVVLFQTDDFAIMSPGLNFANLWRSPVISLAASILLLHFLSGNSDLLPKRLPVFLGAHDKSQPSSGFHEIRRTERMEASVFFDARDPLVALHLSRETACVLALTAPGKLVAYFRESV